MGTPMVNGYTALPHHFPCFKVGSGRVSGSFTPRIPADQEGFRGAMLNDKELVPILDEMIDRRILDGDERV